MSYEQPGEPREVLRGGRRRRHQLPQYRVESEYLAIEAQEPVRAGIAGLVQGNTGNGLRVPFREIPEESGSLGEGIEFFVEEGLRNERQLAGTGIRSTVCRTTPLPRVSSTTTKTV